MRHYQAFQLGGVIALPQFGSWHWASSKHGTHILTQGWYSGAVFGPYFSAAAVSKLLDLDAVKVEDALGIACTQACGLTSAQDESELKRMQYGFPARNGLVAALLARRGYIGIKKVYEREFGGFLDVFSKGNEKDPQCTIDELTSGLDSVWKTENLKLKLYSTMAATHSTVDCIRKLQEQNKEKMARLQHHGEYRPRNGQSIIPPRCLVSPAASHQRRCANELFVLYVTATQMVDNQVMPQQFRHDMLDRDIIYSLMKAHVERARGVDPELSNEEIVEKWRGLMKGVIDDERRVKIEKLYLGLDECGDVMKLCELLRGVTQNPIAEALPTLSLVYSI